MDETSLPCAEPSPEVGYTGCYDWCCTPVNPEVMVVYTDWCCMFSSSECVLWSHYPCDL